MMIIILVVTDAVRQWQQLKMEDKVGQLQDDEEDIYAAARIEEVFLLC